MKHFFLILSFLFHIPHIQICTVQITRLQIFIQLHSFVNITKEMEAK